MFTRFFLLLLIPAIYGGDPEHGDIRLLDGSYPWEGRVEIYHSGSWGTIIDTNWTNEDAIVICHELGYILPGAIAQPNGYYGEGNVSIHLDFVQCSGSESTLTECVTNLLNEARANHSFDVGVKCQSAPSSFRDGDVRLVKGSYNWNGCVEILLSGTWGSINDSSWTDEDANVICRQLQFSSGTSSMVDYCENETGYISEIVCDGAEVNITSCNFSVVNNRVMLLSHPVAVQCQQGHTASEGQILSNIIEGRELQKDHVNIFLSGKWSRTYGSNNAKVVCRQLGYSLYGAEDIYYNRNVDGEDNDIINLVCSGLEYQLKDCDSFTSAGIRSYYNWRVLCIIGDCNTGDTRLVNEKGDSEADGRVEICSGGRWETVCGKYWTKNNTAVVCRHLGFNDIIGNSFYYNDSSERFGEGTGSIIMDLINCNGTEDRLWDQCSKLTDYYNSECSHADDIGVHCEPASCSDGQLKDIFIYYNYFQIEICSNKRWKTLSSLYWSDQNSNVACRQLGFRGENTLYFQSFWGGSVRHSEYYSCKGEELRLSECEKNTDNLLRSESADVVILCYDDYYYSDGDMRLVEGDNELKGRLEIYVDRRWYRVQSNNIMWTLENTLVVCNYFGYDTSTDIVQDIPLAPSKPLYPYSFKCLGTEYSLLDCSSRDITTSTSTNEVTMSCQQSSCNDGDLKLVGEISDSEQRLEMCLNQRWTTIEFNGWTKKDTIVACRQLKYSTSELDVSHTRVKRGAIDAIQTTRYECEGNENRLIDCSSQTFEMQLQDEVVGIMCISSEDSTSTTNNDLVVVSTIVVLFCFIVFVTIVFIVSYVIVRRRTNRRIHDTEVHDRENQAKDRGFQNRELQEKSEKSQTKAHCEES